MAISVVPLVGTWIEIVNYKVCLPAEMVVPLVGTWIEIHRREAIAQSRVVVPLVGTWIEILASIARYPQRYGSFPLWERGLK